MIRVMVYVRVIRVRLESVFRVIIRVRAELELGLGVNVRP